MYAVWQHREFDEVSEKSYDYKYAVVSGGKQMIYDIRDNSVIECGRNDFLLMKFICTRRCCQSEFDSPANITRKIIRKNIDDRAKNLWLLSEKSKFIEDYDALCVLLSRGTCANRRDDLIIVDAVDAIGNTNHPQLVTVKMNTGDIDILDPDFPHQIIAIYCAPADNIADIEATITDKPDEIIDVYYRDFHNRRMYTRTLHRYHKSTTAGGTGNTRWDKPELIVDEIGIMTEVVGDIILISFYSSPACVMKFRSTYMYYDMVQKKIVWECLSTVERKPIFMRSWYDNYESTSSDSHPIKLFAETSGIIFREYNNYVGEFDTCAFGEQPPYYSADADHWYDDKIIHEFGCGGRDHRHKHINSNTPDKPADSEIAHAITPVISPTHNCIFLITYSTNIRNHGTGRLLIMRNDGQSYSDEVHTSSIKNIHDDKGNCDIIATESFHGNSHPARTYPFTRDTFRTLPRFTEYNIPIPPGGVADIRTHDRAFSIRREDTSSKKTLLLSCVLSSDINIPRDFCGLMVNIREQIRILFLLNHCAGCGLKVLPRDVLMIIAKFACDLSG